MLFYVADAELIVHCDNLVDLYGHLVLLKLLETRSGDAHGVLPGENVGKDETPILVRQRGAAYLGLVAGEGNLSARNGGAGGVRDRSSDLTVCGLPIS